MLISFKNFWFLNGADTNTLNNLYLSIKKRILNIFIKYPKLNVFFLLVLAFTSLQISF